MSTDIPSTLQAAVLKESVFNAKEKVVVKGLDFSSPVNLDIFAQSFMHTGFQATNVALAIDEINRMLSWKKIDDISMETYRCTIFLSYTSNMISSGIRDSIRFLAKHKLINVLVSTAGGIEEDFIKCLAPTYLGDFKLKGRDLRIDGVNRLGNLLIPNKNYCLFEDWLTPILQQMAKEQQLNYFRWTPSKFIHRLGKEINHEDSVYYWAYKNNIPVFCPALTDGSIGDMLYFFSYKNPEFMIDIVEDIRFINDIALRAHCTGMLVILLYNDD